MPGVFTPSTGQAFQPSKPAGTYQYTAGTDGSFEEEPPLLEGKTRVTSTALNCWFIQHIVLPPDEIFNRRQIK